MRVWFGVKEHVASSQQKYGWTYKNCFHVPYSPHTHHLFLDNMVTELYHFTNPFRYVAVLTSISIKTVWMSILSSGNSNYWIIYDNVWWLNSMEWMPTLMQTTTCRVCWRQPNKKLLSLTGIVFTWYGWREWSFFPIFSFARCLSPHHVPKGDISRYFSHWMPTINIIGPNALYCVFLYNCGQ